MILNVIFLWTLQQHRAFELIIELIIQQITSNNNWTSANIPSTPLPHNTASQELWRSVFVLSQSSYQENSVHSVAISCNISEQLFEARNQLLLTWMEKYWNLTNCFPNPFKCQISSKAWPERSHKCYLFCSNGVKCAYISGWCNGWNNISGWTDHPNVLEIRTQWACVTGLV